MAAVNIVACVLIYCNYFTYIVCVCISYHFNLQFEIEQQKILIHH